MPFSSARLCVADSVLMTSETGSAGVVGTVGVDGAEGTAGVDGVEGAEGADGVPPPPHAVNITPNSIADASARVKRFNLLAIKISPLCFFVR